MGTAKESKSAASAGGVVPQNFWCDKIDISWWMVQQYLVEIQPLNFGMDMIPL